MAGRRFSTRSKRRVTWAGEAIDLGDIISGTPQFLVLVPEAIMEEFPTPTVVRMRGQLAVATDAAGGPVSLATVGLGVYLADNAAVAAGTLQLPLRDAGSDWIWWYPAVIKEGSAGQAEQDQWAGFDRVIVDSKAMRKVKNDQALVLVAEVVNAQGTAQANVYGRIRVLLKAP